MADGAIKQAHEQVRPDLRPAPAPPSLVPERDIRARSRSLGSLGYGSTFRRLGRIVTLVSLDVAGIWAGIYSALAVKAILRAEFTAGATAHTTEVYAPFAILVALLLFARSGLYARREARPGFSRILATLFQVAVIALIFALIQGKHFSSYYIFYSSLFVAAAYVCGLRFAYNSITGRLLHWAGYRRRVLLVGPDEQAWPLAQALSRNSSVEYETVGFVSRQPSANGLRHLGLLSELPELLERHAVDEVIIAEPEFPEDRAVELVDACHRRGVSVRIAPSSLEVLIHRVEPVPGEGVPLFELKPPVFEGLDYVIKRGFDLIVAGLLLTVLSPLLAIVAALVKLTSRGPMLYRSVRPGIGDRPFDCLKFRTMYTDAERDQASLEAMNEKTGAIFKIRKDPRVTPVGRALRRYSLDELPQLINVLRGEMSLVGPRPLPMRDYGRLEDWHKRRYRVLPGITGLWQVAGRADLDFDDMVRLDFLYLEQWSVLLDLTILLKTFPAVLKRRGAY